MVLGFSLMCASELIRRLIEKDCSRAVSGEHVHGKHLIIPENLTRPYQTLLNEHSEMTSENKYVISNGSD